jgi:hypothetical protein
MTLRRAACGVKGDVSLAVCEYGMRGGLDRIRGCISPLLTFALRRPFKVIRNTRSAGVRPAPTHIQTARWASRAIRRILLRQIHPSKGSVRTAWGDLNHELRSVVSLLILCSTIAAFGQRGTSHGSWIGHLFGYGFLFQVAAVIHWSRKRPEAFWLWIIIIGGTVGALAYFLIEGLPDFRNLQRTLRGPARRKRVQTLRALVIQNPSAGNYEEFGELLLEDKRYREARDAFDRALAVRSCRTRPSLLPLDPVSRVLVRGAILRRPRPARRRSRDRQRDRHA